MQSACGILYCYLCPLWFHNIFAHYLINGTIFNRKLLNIKCLFWFSLQLLSETFLILRRIERVLIKNAYWSSCKVPSYYCQIELRQIFKIYSNIIFHENPSSGSRVVPCGQTDRHDEVNSHSWQFVPKDQSVNDIWDIICVCSGIHMKHISVICG
jgi:hypothetical protein